MCSEAAQLAGADWALGDATSLTNTTIRRISNVARVCVSLVTLSAGHTARRRSGDSWDAIAVYRLRATRANCCVHREHSSEEQRHLLVDEHVLCLHCHTQRLHDDVLQAELHGFEIAFGTTGATTLDTEANVICVGVANVSEAAVQLGHNEARAEDTRDVRRTLRTTGDEVGVLSTQLVKTSDWLLILNLQLLSHETSRGDWITETVAAVERQVDVRRVSGESATERQRRTTKDVACELLTCHEKDLHV